MKKHVQCQHSTPNTDCILTKGKPFLLWFLIFSLVLANTSIAEEIIFETPEIKSFEKGNFPSFRRDVRLETLAAILEGTIHIQCHSYRADELLMFLEMYSS